MGMPATSTRLPRTTDGDDEALRWASARRQFDEVAAAMFEGDYLRALRLARVAARELQAAVGPEHPAHAELEAILTRRQ
jgi:uncharacterized protein HemY